MPVADFSKTEDANAELDEGYNGRRPKEPRAKNIAAWTIPGQVGIRLGYAGENDNAIKREHSVLGGEPREYQRKIQRIINR